MINKIFSYSLLTSTLLLSHSVVFADSNIDKISYALGYEVSKQTPDSTNIEQFIAGIKDASQKKPSKYTDQELQQAYLEYQKIESKNQEIEAKKNLALSEDFLKKNALKSGVKTTKSGLQYKITQQGTGKSPNKSDIVRVQYKGQLTDGTVFDSSYDREGPIEFPLDQVITGWTEGLQLLKEGGKMVLYIPPKLAYGDEGVSGTIPANSVLIFDVELLKILPNK
ncbi:FKBP-type peptidyl-prolyl cis-trans isomerase [Acinetobacter gerneri]|uniref:FKBP-type peptidyl-prolyl cis-trans isomerase n=1 Tax=Acinetobacter gerneri TaxID=202952 RepID=UPI0023F30B58|nr:FKBP-type peptidyl-prolyl cis-trans isomerase [Acinetobacter gerneri]MCH4244383.1 FKBP-type peptidyl-prolyl cis-trans isomerase [Acinetobacter gerneri]